MRYPFLSILFLIVLLTSCAIPKQDKETAKKVAQEIKDRKIKRITANQLTQWIYEKGHLIAESSQKALEREIEQNTKEKDTNIQAIFDEISTLSVEDSLAKAYKATIKKVSFRNPPKNIEGKEQEIFEAYLYALENKEKLAYNILTIEKQDKIYLLFTLPILIQEQTLGMWSVLFSKKEAVLMM